MPLLASPRFSPLFQYQCLIFIRGQFPPSHTTVNTECWYAFAFSLFHWYRRHWSHCHNTPSAIWLLIMAFSCLRHTTCCHNCWVGHCWYHAYHSSLSGSILLTQYWFPIVSSVTTLLLRHAAGYWALPLYHSDTNDVIRSLPLLSRLSPHARFHVTLIGCHISQPPGLSLAIDIFICHWLPYFIMPLYNIGLSINSSLQHW